MLVNQLMTKDVASCRPADPMSEAARILWKRDCGCVPVVEDELGVVGIITDRDICMAAYSQASLLHEMTVESAMSGDVHTCNPADPVSAAEDIMRRKQVRRLPVVDESNHLVGVLSLNDVARAAVSGGQGVVTKEEVAETLAAICDHGKLAVATD